MVIVGERDLSIWLPILSAQHILAVDKYSLRAGCLLSKWGIWCVFLNSKTDVLGSSKSVALVVATLDAAKQFTIECRQSLLSGGSDTHSIHPSKTCWPGFYYFFPVDWKERRFQVSLFLNHWSAIAVCVCQLTFSKLLFLLWYLRLFNRLLHLS